MKNKNQNNPRKRKSVRFTRNKVKSIREFIRIYCSKKLDQPLIYKLKKLHKLNRILGKLVKGLSAPLKLYCIMLRFLNFSYFIILLFTKDNNELSKPGLNLKGALTRENEGRREDRI